MELSGYVPATIAAKTLRGHNLRDALLRSGARVCAISVLLLLGGVIVSLVVGAWPALRHFGLGFIVSDEWNPVGDTYGALSPIYGTLVTSAIAMLIGVPMS